MSKSIILSTTFTKKSIEVRWVSPADLTTVGIQDMQQPDGAIVAQMTTTIEWLKMTANKNNMSLRIIINDKIIIDDTSQDQLAIN